MGVWKLAVLPSDRLASASDDNTVRIWNVEYGQTDLILAGHNFGVTSLAVLPNSELASGSDDGQFASGMSRLDGPD